MIKGHESFGISAEGLTMIRSQINVRETDAVYESLHGSPSGRLLRTQILVCSNDLHNHGIVEMIVATGWTAIWKIEGIQVRSKFSEISGPDAHLMFAEDLRLLLQVGMEILTLSRAGGRL